MIGTAARKPAGSSARPTGRKGRSFKETRSSRSLAMTGSTSTSPASGSRGCLRGRDRRQADPAGGVRLREALFRLQGSFSSARTARLLVCGLMFFLVPARTLASVLAVASVQAVVSAQVQGSASALPSIGRIAVAPDREAFFYIQAKERKLTCLGARCPEEKQLGPRDARALALSLDGAKLYVGAWPDGGDRSVLVTLDSSTGKQLASRELPGRVAGLLSSPDGKYILAWGAAGEARPAKRERQKGFVARVDLSKPRGASVLELFGVPQDAAVEPAGSRLYL